MVAHGSCAGERWLHFDRRNGFTSTGKIASLPRKRGLHFDTRSPKENTFLKEDNCLAGHAIHTFSPTTLDFSLCVCILPTSSCVLLAPGVFVRR